MDGWGLKSLRMGLHWKRGIESCLTECKNGDTYRIAELGGFLEPGRLVSVSQALANSTGHTSF
jgi:hypothetical protein